MYNQKEVVSSIVSWSNWHGEEDIRRTARVIVPLGPAASSLAEAPTSAIETTSQWNAGTGLLATHLIASMMARCRHLGLFAGKFAPGKLHNAATLVLEGRESSRDFATKIASIWSDIIKQNLWLWSCCALGLVVEEQPRLRHRQLEGRVHIQPSMTCEVIAAHQAHTKRSEGKPSSKIRMRIITRGHGLHSSIPMNDGAAGGSTSGTGEQTKIQRKINIGERR
ncbi:hypothetical protein FIBSPDRAFT_995872 [Athelia psychrophila]|uniref:Uncharacterized protein n=1 Tax=Athelia psychrophila TaxID=1759441 RepID=A0A165X868_9AGAM|nr:hypothetical protein FIBSPDRAFT_995872 [Fibularhizoctonia sp. CBS 109695]